MQGSLRNFGNVPILSESPTSCAHIIPRCRFCQRFFVSASSTFPLLLSVMRDLPSHARVKRRCFSLPACQGFNPTPGSLSGPRFSPAASRPCANVLPLIALSDAFTRLCAVTLTTPPSPTPHRAYVWYVVPLIALSDAFTRLCAVTLTTHHLPDTISHLCTVLFTAHALSDATARPCTVRCSAHHPPDAVTRSCSVLFRSSPSDAFTRSNVR